MIGYFNPYFDKTFLGFFIQFFIRMKDFVIGNLSFRDLATDEIQVFVLIGVAISSALVGTFLIFRKMTMLANSLSHTILVGIVAAFLITKDGLLDHQSINIEAMLLAALVMGLLTAFFTEFLTKSAKLQEDASTGIVFTSLFALGIIAVTMLTRNAHIGIEVVMGNVDALHFDDLKLVYTIVLINALSFIFLFKEFKITTFDPGLARALGFSPLFFNYLLMVQTSGTAIGAFRAVGVLMVLALMTGPSLTARLLTHSLKKLLLLAIALGSVASIVGVALSRHILTVHGLALSTGGLVVCVIVLIYLGVIVYRKAPFLR